MANSIKPSGEGYALQVTGPARTAGLVEEDEDGEAQRRATVRVHGFAGLLLAVDVDSVDERDEAELVASAARDTGTAYRAIEAQVQHSGNGYQVQLPPAEDAGFMPGDRAPVVPVPGILLIHSDDRDGLRLAQDLEALRRQQVNT